MSMVFSYHQLLMRSPVRTLRGRPTRPKPLVNITVLGPSDSRVVLALLDTGADDTVFPDTLASKIGVDLTNAPEIEVAGVGGTSLTVVRLAQVNLRLATANEQREWPALVGFTSLPLRFPLLGFAGCLQYFDANFFGDREEVELTINSLYPGK